MKKATVKDVENFWSKNPLFTGEVEYDLAHPNKFFKSHDKVYFNDVLWGINIESAFYLPNKKNITLDLGCGIGFWSNLFVKHFSIKNLYSADLTNEALKICKLRVPKAKVMKENAEKLTFKSSTFDHVNCQGVIHHTPDTQACLNEIYRVLKPGATASVSVYYKNYLLMIANNFLPVIKIFAKLLLRDTGRGRDFTKVKNLNDLVRYYDGNKNPIGKAYSKDQYEDMLIKAGFKDIKFQYFFFPFRFVKLRFPMFFKSFLLKIFPFMIIANLKK